MSPGGIPLGEWSGSAATDRLRETVERFNVEAGRQTKWLVRLTWAIAVLTFMMTLGLAWQVYLAIKKGC